MRNTLQLATVLLALFAHAATAQTNVSTTLGLTGDEDSNAGAFAGLDLLFNESDRLSGSIGVNRPSEGFEDSRSLNAALDYGHSFGTVSVSAGAGIGDREGFTSRKARAGLTWQSDSLLLGTMLERSRIEATSYISGITRVIELEDEFSITGAGARLGVYGARGLSLDFSFMVYDEPPGLRFRNVDQLSNRLISAELERLVSDGRRIDPLRLENRVNQAPLSYTNATSVLSDTFALSLSYRPNVHEFGIDFYRDTYALVDADMRTWDVRWMFPLSNANNLLELWAGSSELQGSSAAFGGLRFIFYR